ncbi:MULTISPECIES: hypothetical protein [unclassified Streptomyces]|uniref:hypothetical protein n=1 Tax=unclassified Streptomyces TaxID=2593676 RepID=UPI0008DC677E|nr:MULTISPECIES: hypothetical protein [unclassified Streptomyces]OII64718.1 hypothetical protein BJP39_09595 [Streptomyces sp. CC77]
MKLRRIAVAAAAAVVGPALLTATPALAQENPAVTVPDAAPKEDAPQAETQDYWEDGPAVSGSVPEVFQAGTPQVLALTYDNSLGGDVVDYVPTLAFGAEFVQFDDSNVTVEVRGGDGQWRPASFRPESLETGAAEFALGTFDLTAGQKLTLDVRIGFAQDAPNGWLEITTAGSGSTPDGGWVVTGATWHNTAIEGGSEQESRVGPQLTLSGLPSSGFVAGGAWQEFTMHVDNTGIEALDTYYVGINLTTGWEGGAWLNADQIRVEAYGLDENDALGWYPVEVDGSEDAFSLAIGAMPLDAGEQTEVKLRLRFAADAAPRPVSLHTVGWGDLADGVSLTSDTATYRTAILAAPAEGGDGTDGNGGDTGTGGTDTGTGSETGSGSETGKDDQEGTAGNDPKPAGGGTTQVTHTGTTTTATPTATGGELAETGADAATSWAVGGAALTLAMGGAFVAGTGRHRRRTQGA